MASGNEKNLDKLVKRLRKVSEAESANNLNEKKAERFLHQLQSMRLTVDQLQRSGLAAIVSRLRKLLKSEAALKAARRLIKDWRLAVAAEAQQEQRTARDQRPEREMEKVEQKRKKVEPPASQATSAASLCHRRDEAAPDAAAASEPGNDVAATTGDPVRDKCREMLQQALHQPAPTDDEDAREADTALAAASRRSPSCLAADVESSVFAEFGGVAGAKYKGRLRSLLMNLRDPKNPGLRHCLRSGALAAAAFARMTSEQMASAEMRQLRERLAKEAIRGHQSAAATASTEPGSSLFTCKRCRKKNCTYNQLQTLSGDEPMTTYVLCYECGFRWKFN